MEFTLEKTSGNARACTIKTKHSTIKTPVFMPVGTIGSVKALDMEDVVDMLGAEIILANTYHMYLRPGDKTVAKMGKLHNFTTYPKSFLTDSGGFKKLSPPCKLGGQMGRRFDLSWVCGNFSERSVGHCHPSIRSRPMRAS